MSFEETPTIYLSLDPPFSFNFHPVHAGTGSCSPSSRAYKSSTISEISLTVNTYKQSSFHLFKANFVL